MKSSELVFNTKQYLPLCNSASWIKSGGAYLDNSGNLVIPKGAAAYCEVGGLCDIQFNYFKVEVRAKSASFDPESSLDSDVLMHLKLNYYASNGSSGYSENCSMNISTLTPVGDEYEDVKILDTLNILVYKATFTIENKMGTDLIIKSIKLFTSDDISSSQIIDTVNSSLNRKSAVQFGFGTNKDRTVFKELAVYTGASLEPILFRPVYDGEWPVGIEVSTSGVVPCIWYEVEDS